MGEVTHGQRGDHQEDEEEEEEEDSRHLTTPSRLTVEVLQSLRGGHETPADTFLMFIQGCCVFLKNRLLKSPDL